MLFNSFAFLFVFLPVAWVAARLARRAGGVRVAQAAIVVASLVFYAMWDVRYLPLLLASVAANYAFGGAILGRLARRPAAARAWMVAGVGCNLALLAGFKYAYFAAENLAALWSAPAPFGPIVLPLALSFVTFQKIAYLVDCQRGRVPRHDALDYLFFVSFFPQLIAGPIVHHRSLVVQADPAANTLFAAPGVPATGLFFLAAGLFKKVVLADSLARFATPVFDMAARGAPEAVGFGAAWQAMLAYTLQLYFDFSGYSDMAIGLALLFGYRLPLNFDSPYQAASLIAFWRSWHMSLSTFLRDYLYVPLGGNRSGIVTRYRSLLVTMMLAGLWHGAGWTFVLWGAGHGVLLVANHVWRALVRRPAVGAIWRRVPQAVPCAITFLCVALGWVVFRAGDLAASGRIYAALLRPAPMAPGGWPGYADLAEAFLAARAPAGWLWVGLGLAIVWALPNTARLACYDPTPNAPWRSAAGPALGLLTGLALWFSLKWMAVQPSTEFLYFNF